MSAIDSSPDGRSAPDRVLRRWAFWFAVLAVTTVALLAVRERLQTVHVALPFLLIVLLGSVGGGRALGIALSAVA